MPEDVKLCKDCKYSHIDFFDTLSYCRHSNHGVDLVSGEVLWHSCAFSRKQPSQCSQEAKWFEPRQSVVKRVINLLKIGNK